MDSLADRFAWMAWTPETAIFFAAVVLLLLTFTLLARYRPETPRLGLLRIETTRGDRLFVTLLGSAFIHLLWLAFAPAEVELWWASILSLVYAGIVFRWV